MIALDVWEKPLDKLKTCPLCLTKKKVFTVFSVGNNQNEYVCCWSCLHEKVINKRFVFYLHS